MIPGELVTLAPDRENAGQFLTTITLWKPQSNLPWRARKRGTETYIWYSILDAQGDEMCTFGAVRHGEEHDEMFRQLVHLLVCINGKPEVQISDKRYSVVWGAERIKTENLG